MYGTGSLGCSRFYRVAAGTCDRGRWCRLNRRPREVSAVRWEHPALTCPLGEGGTGCRRGEGHVCDTRGDDVHAAQGGQQTALGFPFRESQSRGHAPTSTELCAQSRLGGPSHPSCEPAVSARGGGPPGDPPRLLSGGGCPGDCWWVSIRGPLSRDNENVPWGRNRLGSIYASARL